MLSHKPRGWTLHLPFIPRKIHRRDSKIRDISCLSQFRGFRRISVLYLAYIPQPHLLAFDILESLVEFGLEFCVDVFSNLLELRRKRIRIAQLLLQPRNNFALDGERGERYREITEI